MALKVYPQQRRPLTKQDFVEANVALMRFGLGPRPLLPTEIAWTPTTPGGASAARQACLNEIDEPNVAIYSDAGLASEVRCGMEGMNRPTPTHPKTMENPQGAAADIEPDTTLEMQARYWKHLEARVGFVERLVLFWSNHFSVSREKSGIARAMVIPYERLAIRPYVLGNFAEMLKAVMQQTVMLEYLDNTHNYYVNQPKPGYGYNENLAREILDVHTLGTMAYGSDTIPNYQRSDIQALTKLLTGWFGYGSADPTPSLFRFLPGIHNPNPQTMLGMTFYQPGQQKGLAALEFLANHRQTSYHIARKLLIHFVKDDPSDSMIRSLADVFYNNRNQPDQLKRVAAALVNMDEAWIEPMTRVRPPHLWLIAVTRALSLSKARSNAAVNTYRTWLRALHNAPWECRTPDGYPDLDIAWRDPGTIFLRLSAASALLKIWVTDDDLPTMLEPGLRYATTFTAVGNTATTEKIRNLAQTDKRMALAFMSMTPQLMYR